MLPAKDGNNYPISIAKWPRDILQVANGSAANDKLYVVAFYDACREQPAIVAEPKTNNDVGLDKWNDRCSVFQACSRGEQAVVDNGTLGVNAGFFTKSLVEALQDLSKGDPDARTTGFLSKKIGNHLKTIEQVAHDQHGWNGSQTLPPLIPNTVDSANVPAWFGATGATQQ
jgi:hypothetical protein